MTEHVTQASGATSISNADLFAGATEKTTVEKVLVHPATMLIGFLVGIIGLIFSIVPIVRSDPVSALISIAISCFVFFGSMALCAVSLIVSSYARQMKRRVSQIEQNFCSQTDNLHRQIAAINRQHESVASALHLFIHAARDHMVRCTNEFERFSETPTLNATEFVEKYRGLVLDYMRVMSEEMLRVFQPLVPPQSKLWAAIREARTNNTENKLYFHTILRTGGVNPDRHQTSIPVAADRGLPRRLMQCYQNGEGIVVLGQERTADNWDANPNDHRGDDKSVMAGPIMVKLCGPPQMTMILYVNSPENDVFREEDKPYMKCCTDVLSMFVNIFSRYVEIVKKDN
jgi:hypothetical protein